MSLAKERNARLETTWIPESNQFFAHVIGDTIKNLYDNETFESHDGETKALKKLEKIWLQKYNLNERMAKSNHKPKPKSRPPPRKRIRTTVSKRTEPNDKLMPPINCVDDKEVIMYRICIPPLKKHWKCRTFDLIVKAYVAKRNLIGPLINWKLLDSIMDTTPEEGTAVFQSCVDNL